MRDAADTLVLIQWVIFALLMGFLLGLAFTSNYAHKAGANHSRHVMTQWVETCWPNKLLSLIHI